MITVNGKNYFKWNGLSVEFITNNSKIECIISNGDCYIRAK